MKIRQFLVVVGTTSGTFVWRGTAVNGEWAVNSAMAHARDVGRVPTYEAVCYSKAQAKAKGYTW